MSAISVDKIIPNASSIKEWNDKRNGMGFVRKSIRDMGRKEGTDGHSDLYEDGHGLFWGRQGAWEYYPQDISWDDPSFSFRR